MINKYLIVLVFILITACRKENDFKFIDTNTVINYDTITKVNENRGILTMRSFRFNKYNVYSWDSLIYKDTLPKWIKGKQSPDISDIDVPFVIFKHKDENYFSIIKNSDTLKFTIERD